MLKTEVSRRTKWIVLVVTTIAAAAFYLSNSAGSAATPLAGGPDNGLLKASIFGEWSPKLPWQTPSVRPLGPLAGTVSLTSFTTAYTQNFDTLASSGDTNTTVPEGWAFSEAGRRAVSTGCDSQARWLPARRWRRGLSRPPQPPTITLCSALHKPTWASPTR